MKKWKCKHCNQEFDFEKTCEKANHSRWCEFNPKLSKYKEDNSLRALKMVDDKYGEIKEFQVICDKCSDTFTVKERENAFPTKEKYHCSRSCANSCGGQAKVEKYGIAHYKTILLKYHDHRCLVCGFDKIIDAHHVDENHNNNDPINLVPLCPNHHRLFHSRYRDDVEPYINKYIENFKSLGLLYGIDE